MPEDTGWGVAGSYKPIIGDANISFQKSVSDDKAWTVYSLGYSVSVGPSGGAFAGGSGGFEFHSGKTWLLRQLVIPSSRVPWYGIVGNWLEHTILQP